MHTVGSRHSRPHTILHTDPRPRPVAAAVLLALAHGIDRITLCVGHTVRWLTLAIPLVCFSYAAARKVFPWGHNGFSELQWYLFAFVYLLAAGYTLLLGQHVRVDFFWRRFRHTTKCWIDLGFLVPLLGVCLYLAFSYWDFWVVSLRQRETPEDVLTGLERWPIKLALFAGFTLLAFQCLAESIKRLALLKGWITAHSVYPEGAEGLPS